MGNTSVDDIDSLLRRTQQVCNYKLLTTNLSREEKEDIVQDVLLKVYLSLDKYDSKKAMITTWIDRVIDNMIKDGLRKIGSKKNLMLKNAVSIDTSPDEDNATEKVYSRAGHDIPSVDYRYEIAEMIIDFTCNLNLNELEVNVFKLRSSGFEFYEIADLLGYTKSRIYQVWGQIKKK